jgi:Tfp pilus assembly protein PilF
MNRSMTHPNSVGTTNGAGTPPPASRLASPNDAAMAPELELPVSAADERPAPPDALQQARDFLDAGEQAAALTTLRALIAREPRQVRARGLLAEVLATRNDVDGALLELGRALDISPDDVPVLCARAALQTARGRFDPAEADLRRAIRVDPESADVQLQLGVLFCKRARWREAIEPLRAAATSDPNRVAAHYYLGEAYNSIDDLPAALSSYQTAASLDPSHHRALKAIGVVLDRLKRPNDAALAYQRAREAQRR